MGAKDFQDMTVNERLFAAGLLAQWDAAVFRRERKVLIELLNRVELTDQASVIANATLGLSE
jgi:flagellar biosynthesis regulator FlbT